MLNQRQRALVARLIEDGAFIPVTELAQRLGVSPRSVRYDLEAVEAYLRSTPVRLERHRQKGVRVLVPVGEQEDWLARLRPDASALYRLSPEERRLSILAALLRRSGTVSLGRLADEMYVSRRTLVEDLKQVECWLAERQLTLCRLPRGLSVQGEEAAWRQALAELLGPSPIRDLQPLAPDELRLIRSAVREAAGLLAYQLADVAVDALTVHIAVAAMRLRAGQDIRMDPAQLAELERLDEWVATGHLAVRLEQALGVRLPRDEWGYIALHLLGAKTVRAAVPQDETTRSLSQAVDVFISAVGARLGVDLTRDGDLNSGLLLHLRPALYRMRYGLRLVNPLKEQILAQYGYLMDAVRYGVVSAPSPLGTPLVDDELAYLAMHVGASLERCIPCKTARVLLVCASGIGTSRLLESRMRRAFPDAEIAAVLPVEGAHRPGAAAGIDLIVSTVPLPSLPTPVVVVNPFLTPEDVTQIRNSLPVRGTAPVAERMIAPVLADVLDHRAIRLDVSAGDWEDAIRLGGALLVERGTVRPSYVDAMVQMVRRVGPYIVLDKGVALPHARPEDGVLQLGFSFLRLKEPVSFGHETNDPVRLVICLASPDNEIHLRALQQLANLLSDPGARQTLEQGSSDDILALMQRTNAAEGR
jgi:activator of the mannose operon, transcriptional antiterminator